MDIFNCNCRIKYLETFLNHFQTRYEPTDLFNNPKNVIQKCSVTHKHNQKFQSRKNQLVNSALFVVIEIQKTFYGLEKRVKLLIKAHF